MSRPNSSSSAITSSTMSSESAPRSSMNLASGWSCLTSTSSSFAMISLTLPSSNDAMLDSPPVLGDSTSNSLHHHAAVHGPRLAGDVTGPWRGEERDHLRDVLRRAESAERDPGLEFGPCGLRQLRRHLRRDEPRADRVHRDRTRRELTRQRLREPEQAGLAGAVVRLAGVADEPDNGRHVDD